MVKEPIPKLGTEYSGTGTEWSRNRFQNQEPSTQVRVQNGQGTDSKTGNRVLGYGYSMVKEPIPKSGTKYIFVHVLGFYFNLNDRGMQTHSTHIEMNVCCHAGESLSTQMLTTRFHVRITLNRNGCSVVDINMPNKIRSHPSHNIRYDENMNI